MKKSMLWRDAFREIKRSRNRFISILLIVLLGAGFFVGVKATAPSIRYTAEEYFEAGNLFDLRLLSPVGFDDDDIKAISAIGGVADIVPSYTIDMLLRDDDITAVKVSAITDDVNKLTLIEGRMPDTDGECVLLNNRFSGNVYKIGDVISFSEELDGAPTTDYIKNTEYLVVGICNSPAYFSYTYDTTTVGSGAINHVIYVLPSEFQYLRYTELLVTLDVGDGVTTFDDEYFELVEDVSEKITALGEIRVEKFIDDSQSKADDAERQLEDMTDEVNRQLEDAKKQLDDAKSQIDDAVDQINNGWKEFDAKRLESLEQIDEAEKLINENKKQLADAEKQLVTSEADYNAAKTKFDTEFTSAKKQLDSAKAQLDSARREYNSKLAEYNRGYSEYTKALEKYNKGLAEYNKGETEYKSKLAEYNTGLAEYNASVKEFDAAEKKYNDALELYNKSYDEYVKGHEELDPLITEYNEKKALYDSKYKEYTDGEAEYAESLEKYNAAYQEYKDGLAQYNATLATLPYLQMVMSDSDYQALLAQLAQTKIMLDQTKRELSYYDQMLKNARKELDGYKIQLEEGKAELDSAWEELGPYVEQLDEAEKELAEGRIELDKGKLELDGYRTEIEEGKKKLDEAKSQLESARAELDSAKAEINSGKKELDSSKKLIDSGKKQLDDANKQLTSGQNEYDKNLKKYSSEYASAKKQLDDAAKQINDGRKTIEEGKKTLSEKEAELAEAKLEAESQLTDAERELREAEKKVEESREEYNRGLTEYNASEAEAKRKLSDAERQIRLLSELLDGDNNMTWYAFDRITAVVQFKSLCDDCERLDAIVNIFPVFFLAVACLVCLTTMTRMIDEHRTFMGTYKALGYSSHDIKKKYIYYALTASVIGGIIGIAIAVQVLPRAIFGAYTIMYQFGVFTIVMPWMMAVLSMIVSVSCVVIITEICCSRELKIKTAALMRPKAPRAGKKILLERIGFIWNRFGFHQKVTARNLFRYKVRLIMTVLGISGCMMLMVSGFALKNAIIAFVDRQFGDIYHYDLQVVPNVKYGNDEIDAVLGKIESYDFIDTASATMQKSISVKHGEKLAEEYITLFVPNSVNDISKTYFMYPLGKSYTEAGDVSPIKLSGDGIIMTERLSKMLDVSPGDKVTLIIDDDIEYTVKVDDICKNYVYHNIYMSREYYKTIAGEDAELSYNMIEARLCGEYNTDEVKQTIMNDMPDITYVVSMESASELLGDMVDGLNTVVVIMILCAGMLAFLVVYNLTNINISERVREIATIKVLGFKHFEVDMYVFRENMIMSVAGILFGSVFGYFLAEYMIETVEVNNLLFERSLPPTVYIYSMLLTLIFTLLVNLMMTRRIKSISMVESLKAIE